MGNVKVFIDLGSETLLSNDFTLWSVDCRGEQCPAATTCAVGKLLLDADGSVLTSGGTASLSLNVYKGPETAVSGNDFELVGELGLGKVTMVPHRERRINEQAVDGMVTAVDAHLSAGQCLVQLAQR